MLAAFSRKHIAMPGRFGGGPVLGPKHVSFISGGWRAAPWVTDMNAPFTSLRYPFAIDPARGRVAQEPDYAQHIEQLVMQVLMTAPGERINRPDFGCGVKRLVFAPGGEVAATLAQTAVYQALTKWLPSAIQVVEVTARAHDALLQIRIGYVVKARGETRYLNLQVAP